MVLPEAFCVLSHRGELWNGRLNETIDRIETEALKAIDAGKEYREEISQPESDIWVYDDLAAVWTGHRTFVDEDEVSYGIRVFSLHRTADGWKLSGIADIQGSEDSGLHSVSKASDGEIMKPIHLMLDSMEHRDWDMVITPCLTGTGITNSRQRAGLLLSSTWPQLRERIKEIFARVPTDVVLSEVLYDVEIRVSGEFRLCMDAISDTARWPGGR